jgi:hypothetical protein
MKLCCQTRYIIHLRNPRNTSMLRNYDAQEKRRKQIRLLNAVSQFRASKYDAAIDIFTELDSNPAKVVALYPESVSGRLGVPASKWVTLFGGPEKVSLPPVQEGDTSESESSDKGEQRMTKSPGPQGEVSGEMPIADSKSQPGLSAIPGLSVSSLAKARLQQSDAASIISLRKGVPGTCYLLLVVRKSEI